MAWGFILGLGLGLGTGVWWVARWGSPRRSLQFCVANHDYLQQRAWRQLAADAVPLIPILTRQIEGVMEQTETATLRINTSILAIAARAESQVSRIKSLLESLKAQPVQPALPRETLAAASETLTASTKELSSDVARIVMALQFQDITKQQLQHVVTPLEQLHASIEALMRGDGLEDGNTSNLLQALHRSYTMESERTVMAHSLTGQVHPIPGTGSAAGHPEGDATLF
jgi:hypothetical protein